MQFYVYRALLGAINKRTASVKNPVSHYQGEIMPLPDLCLLPHEVGDLAPDETLCAPAESRIQVESGASKGSYLIRRGKSNNGQTRVFVRRESPNSPLLHIYSDEVPSDEEVVAKIATGSVYRCLYFDSYYRLLTSIRRQNFQLWIHNDDKGYINWNSSDGGSVNIRGTNEGKNNRCGIDWKFDTPSEQIERDINSMLSDEDSYFSFANRWEQLDEKEEQSRLISLENGNLDELRKYLRILVWSMEECALAVGWHLNLKVSPKSNYQSDADYIHEIASSVQLMSPKGNRQLPEHGDKLIKVLLQYFYPHRNDELEKSLKFYGMWDGSDDISFNLRLYATIANAHERLEARLQLRDFLRDKVSPAELAELMAQ